MSPVENHEIEGGLASDIDEKKRVKPSPRELRRKAREGLRSRTLGVGLSISSKPKSISSNRVVFGENDDEELDTGRIDREVNKSDSAQSENDNSGSESDDDSAVEEVQSNVARKQAMQQRAIERETIKSQKLHSYKTKKRKKPVEGSEDSPVEANDDNDEDEFDEDFFSEVDAEISTKRQKLRGRNQIPQPTGRHTTFVSAIDDDAAHVAADHNIELVILGTNAGEDTDSRGLKSERFRKAEARMGTKPSKVALSLSRSRLVAGDEQPTNNSTPSKGSSKTKRKDEHGWKRSKKMNRLASSRVRSNRRGGRGAPAAHFAKKT